MLSQCHFCCLNKPDFLRDASFVCDRCIEDDTKLIPEYQMIKKLGIGKLELFSIGSKRIYAKNGVIYKYCSVESAVNYATRVFPAFPKRQKKLEKFKAEWEKNKKKRQEIDNIRSKIIDNVMVATEKFEYPFDFNSDKVKNIIGKRLDGLYSDDLVDPQLVHVLTNDLERYAYYMARKDSLDSMIDDQIHVDYRQYVEDSDDYKEYLGKHYDTDEHLEDIMKVLYQKYKAKEWIDDRERSIIKLIEDITNESRLTELFLENAEIRKIRNDHSIEDPCQMISDMLMPVMEKMNQLKQIMEDLRGWVFVNYS